jgi:hypothetical protein
MWDMAFGEMRSHITAIALAAAFATALISATPALALPNMPALETVAPPSPPAENMSTRRKMPQRLLRRSLNRARVQRVIEEPAR